MHIRTKMMLTISTVTGLVLIPSLVYGATQPAENLAAGQSVNVNCPTHEVIQHQSNLQIGISCDAVVTTTTTVTTTVPATTTTTTAGVGPTTTVPVTATTVPVTTTTVPSGGSIWTPAINTPWMWEISSNLVTTNANLMGTGVTAWNGDTAPGDNPQMIDIDGILNPASTVSELHARGVKAVCYIETGTAGNYYSAADEGIPTTYYDQLLAAGDLGDALSGYPEKFVNMNSASTVTIMEAMIKQQCANKGFDGVETDLDMAWSGADGTTGFSTSEAQGEAYNITLAKYMHSLNLAWVAKNLTEVGTSKAVTDVVPYLQGEIDEECNATSAPCSLLNPVTAAGHPVWNAEYTQDGETTGGFCAADNAAGFNGVLFSQDLNGGRQPCR